MLAAVSARAGGPGFAHFQKDGSRQPCAAAPEQANRDELQRVAVCVAHAPADPVPSPEHMRIQNCTLPGPTPGSFKPVKIVRVSDDDEEFAMVHGDMAACSVNHSMLGGVQGLDGATPLVVEPSAFKYVHVLAVARDKMTGAEDFRSKTLKKLWSFSWSTAKAYIMQENEIVLLAEAPKQREQDQLHIDIVRFGSNARDRFFVQGNYKVASGLSSIWDVAEAQAAALGARLGIAPGGDGSYLGTKRFGVAVAQGPGGKGYAVVVKTDEESLDKSFAEPCPDPGEISCRQDRQGSQAPAKLAPINWQ